MRPQERRRNERRPEIEPLESRALLSTFTSGASDPPPTSHSVATSTSTSTARRVALNLKVGGTYQVIETNPDVGRDYQLRTESTGRTHGLGQTQVDGAIGTPGFVARGYASGQLVARTGHGEIRIQLAGPTTAGFSAIPSQLSFTITGGTGYYSNARGYGTVDVVLQPRVTPSTTETLINSGTATLTFHAFRVMRG
jgi:hypothetical protein